jgi:hypothetical protein
MSTSLEPRYHDSPYAYVESRALQPTRREVTQVARAVRRVQGQAVVVATRMNAGAYVTSVALHNTALLSKDEEQLIQFAPLGEARYKALVDGYTMYALRELGRL